MTFEGWMIYPGKKGFEERSLSKEKGQSTLLNGGNTMLLQMFLGSMNHLHRNELESKINIPSTPSLYPLFSNRAMISPTNPLMTPSGLTAMKVCSVDIFRVCCELKSLVI
jgi:hypothetical protein